VLLTAAIDLLYGQQGLDVLRQAGRYDGTFRFSLDLLGNIIRHAASCNTALKTFRQFFVAFPTRSIPSCLRPKRDGPRTLRRICLSTLGSSGRGGQVWIAWPGVTPNVGSSSRSSRGATGSHRTTSLDGFCLPTP
jgi:hypothetical protein